MARQFVYHIPVDANVSATAVSRFCRIAAESGLNARRERGSRPVHSANSATFVKPMRTMFARCAAAITLATTS